MSSPLQGSAYPGTFRLASYITARGVNRLLADKEQVKEVIDRLANWGVERIFIEVYRNGEEVPEPVLAGALDMFRRAGIKTSGGLTCCWGEGFGAPSSPQSDEQGAIFCFSNPKTAEDLARVSARAASLFDELILDDYFFTNCECELCRTAKGDRSWPQFRCELMAEFAARAILAPAHDANPNCKVIVKFPQWYDRFHQFGYNVDAHTAQFDGVWIGTETRNPYKSGWQSLSHVPQTQSWSVYQWVNGITGGEALGGWFDPYNCDVPSYIEQAYQTALVGAGEVILFNYGSLTHKGFDGLLDSLLGELPRVRRWAKSLQGATPAGVACYKPTQSDGRDEKYVCDYLALCGVPTTMHAKFPADAPIVFLPAHALADAEILPKLRKHLAAGRSVLATAQFVAGLDDATAEELFGLAPKIGLDDGPTYSRRFHADGESFYTRHYINLTGRLKATDADVLVSWGIDPADSPYLTSKSHGQAAAMMLDAYTMHMPPRAGVNLGQNVRMADLHQGALDCLRRAITAPLNLEIRSPGRVGVYLFEGGPLALCNYRNEPAEIELKASPGCPLGSLSALTIETEANVTIHERGDDFLKLTLPARDRVLLAVAT